MSPNTVPASGRPVESGALGLSGVPSAVIAGYCKEIAVLGWRGLGAKVDFGERGASLRLRPPRELWGKEGPETRISPPWYDQQGGFSGEMPVRWASWNDLSKAEVTGLPTQAKENRRGKSGWKRHKKWHKKSIRTVVTAAGGLKSGPVVIWSPVFLFVTLQMTTTLRPILGRSDSFRSQISEIMGNVV